MIGARPRPLRVLLCSSGNPDATFLAAGLLRGQPGKVSAVLIQGTDQAVPAAAVGQVLADQHRDLGDWAARVVPEASSEPVDVGLTICVPTWDT